MSIDRKNTEILDQKHQMYAEGTSDIKPTAKDIELFLKHEGWDIYNLDIFFDSMQGFWRWNCDIVRF